VKNTKNIISAVIIVIAVGVLLFFAGPSPEKEEGIKLLRLGSIVLSALAGIILLVVLVKYSKAIIRSIITNLPSVIAVTAAGLFACILFFVDWPVEIMMKVELLRSVLIASLALVGFVSIILIESIRGNGDFTERFGISSKGINKFKGFLGQSIFFGCLAILAILVYFVIYEINTIYMAWIFFLLQLALLIIPLLFAKIIVLR
jgi:hypothetical protein